MVRRDIYEVIRLEGRKKIKLNSAGEKGWEYVEDDHKEGKKVKIKLAGGEVVTGTIVEEEK